jgi:hypothetical protein
LANRLVQLITPPCGELQSLEMTAVLQEALHAGPAIGRRTDGNGRGHLRENTRHQKFSRPAYTHPPTPGR